MSSTESVSAIFEAILQRPADPGELLAFLDDAAPDATIAARIAASAEALAAPASVIRMYEAVFGRKPDPAGLNYWVDRLTSEPGFDIYKMAQFLVGSNEFNDRYGIIGLDATSAKQALIEGLYKNVLGRQPDADGLKFWLASDMSPAQMLTHFSESKEFVARAAPKIQDFLVDIAVNGGTDPSRTDRDDYTGSIFDQQQATQQQFVNSPATITGAATGTVTEDGAKIILNPVPVPVDAPGQPAFPVPAVAAVRLEKEAEAIRTKGQLKIEDPDAGESVFRAVDAQALKTKYGVFTFDSLTGAWTFTLDNKAAQELKSGQKVEQKLTVFSVDGSASKDIIVTVHGFNDRAEFGGKAEGAVTEDGKIQTASGTLTVSDLDAGETGFKAVDAGKLATSLGTFTFDEGKGDWTFALDNKAAQKLKGAEPAAQTLTVSSLDGSTRDITVTVTGVNDAPVFGGDIAGALAEDSKTTTASGTLKVEDPDAGESGFATDVNVTKTYGTFDFKADSGKWTFAIDEKAAQALNKDEQATETMTVTAKDGATQEIKVTITGAADKPTDIALTASTVQENKAGATIGKLATSDPDAGNTFTYTVSDDRFEVIAGELRLKAGESLDFESNATIKLDITSTDQSGLKLTKQVTINVVDVNEKPTNIALSNSGVSENSAGSSIGTLSTADPDAASSFTYSVNDDRFQIVGNDLRLKAGQALDFETASTVSLQVTSTDQGGLSVTKDFKIQVSNANEDPTNITLSSNSVQENKEGAVIGTLTTTDPDSGNTFTYGVNDTARFEIVNGVLKLKAGKALDYEATKSVSVNVTSTDQGNLSVTKTIIVNVTNDTADDVKLPATVTTTDDPTDYNQFGKSRSESFDDTEGFSDIVYAGAGNDTIEGRGGSDFLYAGSGNDIINGGDQDDVIFGGSGNDTINGGDEGDYITGGYGEDDLTGGPGADSFFFSDIKDTNDMIRDFTGSQFSNSPDRIVMSNIDANSLQANDQNFQFVAQAVTAPKVEAHKITWMVSGGDVVIFADTDGNTGSIEFMLTLKNVSSVVAKDFTL